MPKADWEKLRKFVKEQGYKYEASGAGNLVHIEMYLSSDEMKKVNDVIDHIDDGTYESYNRHSNRINRRRIKESRGAMTNRYISGIKNAVNIINDYLINGSDSEELFLPDLLMRGSNTYNFAHEYLNDDWTLNADKMIADYEEEISYNTESNWNPCNYLFNILSEVVGYSYVDAEKVLGFSPIG